MSDTETVGTSSSSGAQEQPPNQDAAYAETAIVLLLRNDQQLVPINDISQLSINGHPVVVKQIATPHEAYRLCMDAADQYSSMRVAAQIIQTTVQISSRTRDDVVAILGGPSGVDRLRSLDKKRDDDRAKARSKASNQPGGAG